MPSKRGASEGLLDNGLQRRLRGQFSSTNDPTLYQATDTNACEVVAVGKRRDGGTRYWCLHHRANATAKYGKPAKTCRAAHIPALKPQETFSLNVDKYKGGVALWGAVPPVYDDLPPKSVQIIL